MPALKLPPSQKTPQKPLPKHPPKNPPNSPKTTPDSSNLSKNPPQDVNPASDESNSPHPSIIPQNCENVNTNSAEKGSEFVVTPQTWVYSDIVKEHFLNPQNFLMGDESKYPHDAEGIVGNPVCGDQMKMYIRIKDNRIIDIKWKTYGCASAIASTSALSELAKGKTLDEALQIGPAEITDYLGGLPQHKFHCSVLGHEALAAAIREYRKTHKSHSAESLG